MDHDHIGHADGEGGSASGALYAGGKWGPDRALGTSGGVVTWSLPDAGLSDYGTPENFFNGRTVSFDSVVSFDYEGIIQDAFDQWESVANIRFQQVEDGGGSIGRGQSADIRIVTAYIDGETSYLWPSVYGQAFFPVAGNTGAEMPAYAGDIVMDKDEDWDYDTFYSVILHEIGHSIGLLHSLDPNTVMYGTVESLLTNLTAADRTAVREIYGRSDNADFDDDYLAGINTSGSLDVASATTGEIDVVGDADWVFFQVESYNNYRFTLDTAQSAQFSDPVIRLRDSNGNLIGSSEVAFGSGGETVLDYSSDIDRNIFLEVRSDGSSTGAYALSAEILVPDDFSADGFTRGSVSPGRRQAGSLETVGDEDWIAVFASEFKEYEISVFARDGSFGALGDASITLVDFFGTPYAVDEAPDNGALSSFRYSGSFFDMPTVSVLSNSGQTGDYEVEVKVIGMSKFDDFDDSIETTGTLSESASATGVIQAVLDSDWFKISMLEGVSYTFTASTGDFSIEFGSFMSLRDASGAFIKRSGELDFEQGIANAFAHKASRTGDYFVEFENGIDPGAYELRVTSNISSIATPDDDRLVGDSANDSFSALAGNDYVYGFDGNDMLDGGAGRDKLIGGSGNDQYHVEDAGDVVVELSEEGYDRVFVDGLSS
ncbi:matrixin family metalloprotease, partial [Pseudahrensia aquimaris]